MPKGGPRIGSGPKKQFPTPSELARVVKVPTPPPDLPEREHAAWLAWGAQVDAVEVFRASDLYAFRCLVRAQALLDRCLSGEETETDRRGNEKPVSVSAINGLMRTVAHFAGLFRCHPASRGATAALEPAPEADDPDDFTPLTSVTSIATGKPN